MDPGNSFLTNGDPVDTQLQQAKDAKEGILLDFNSEEEFAKYMKYYNSVKKTQTPLSLDSWRIKENIIALNNDEITYVEKMNNVEGIVPVVENQGLEKIRKVSASTLNDTFSISEIRASQSKVKQVYNDLDKQHRDTEEYIRQDITVQPSNAGMLKDE
jgi:hypothetical protein